MSNQCGKTGCGDSMSRICPEGLQYVKKVKEQPDRIAVMACEGACIKGEVARVAANLLAYQMHQQNAVRICLGDAATGNSGFLDLVRQAPQVISIEGCSLQCGTEILKKRFDDLKSSVIVASELYEYDKKRYFEIFDLPRETIDQFAQTVADQVSKEYFGSSERRQKDAIAAAAAAKKVIG